MNFKGAPLKNSELELIYRYLTHRLTRVELADQLGRTRTNTYYYIGRAMHYWMSTGLVRLKRAKSVQDLGGKDLS
jgi:hypothetical protein